MTIAEGLAALAVLIGLGWLVFFRLREKAPGITRPIEDLFRSTPSPTFKHKESSYTEEIQQTYPERRSMM